MTFSQDTALLQVRTIGVSPYGITSSSNSSGIYYDLAEMLANDIDIDVEHYIYPYARIIHELKSGQTDITIMFKYQELEEFVTYIAPLPPIKNVVIGLKMNSFTSIDALKGKSIAYLRGAKFSQAIDNDPSIKKHYTQNFKKAAEMLVAGRVDAMIGPYEALLKAAKEVGFSNKNLGKPLVVSERIPWLQISKKSQHKAFINQLYKSFQKILLRGELERLRDKYTS
ncbi:MAG: transporter substrate-binding domain-containing protein [Colwellia sp.]|nr:transporter substrate-binding domain-containing protein [Colwellia sp.]